MRKPLNMRESHFLPAKGPGQGFGIGLFLASTNIERFGGSVRLFNRPEGGHALMSPCRFCTERPVLHYKGECL
ncbi:MAG: hypothetical protein P0107_03600 [Nitrosomonas sp.]|nr:hypothetical protein [Nitrosomonas sp.]